MTSTIEKRCCDLAQPEPTRGGTKYTPVVDILERGDELVLRADVPGASAENIDINYERGLLTLHARVAGRCPRDGSRRLLTEYGVGDFFRSFQIGEGIDAARISAEVSGGVLTLRLPKTEAVKSRRIAVRGA
ncbi:18 kDa heat shock protein [Phycisphaerae bacterium RAS1]|nr:18 kDa heat shock protein [Phycisphaerae bacterium RAS1]